jgi:hypothetical protein
MKFHVRPPSVSRAVVYEWMTEPTETQKYGVDGTNRRFLQLYEQAYRCSAFCDAVFNNNEDSLQLSF